MSRQRLYFDYAAATPVDSRVFQAMRPYFSSEFGNPGALHSYGQKAIRALDQARQDVASLLGVDFRSVIFTGSATEANNIVVQNVIRRASEANIIHPKVLVSAIEHDSILEAVHMISQHGVEVKIIPVNKTGIIDMKALESEMTSDVLLVSVMYVNNEVGALQPVSRIGKIVEDFRKKNLGSRVLFHIDASQASQLFDCSPVALGADFLTLSGHKMYGPKGVGALIRRNPETPLYPIIHGGGQEFGIRSATENVPLIVGFAKALQVTTELRDKEVRRLEKLRRYFIKGFEKIIPRAKVNGGIKQSSPHIVSTWIPGFSSADMLVRLDLFGVAVSAGSACSSRSLVASHVLRAMNLPPARVKESIRWSFGRNTTNKEVDGALGFLKTIVRK